MKRTIRLTESELHRVIENSVRRIINEGVEYTGKDPNDEVFYYSTKISEIYDEIARLETAVSDDRFKDDIEGLKRYISMMQAHVRKLRQDPDYFDMPPMSKVLKNTPMVNY